jgi:hypothetical protein
MGGRGECHAYPSGSGLLPYRRAAAGFGTNVGTAASRFRAPARVLGTQVVGTGCAVTDPGSLSFSPPGCVCGILCTYIHAYAYSQAKQGEEAGKAGK